MLPEDSLMRLVVSADGDQLDPDPDVNHSGTASKQAPFFSFSRASTFQQWLRPPSRLCSKVLA